MVVDSFVSQQNVQTGIWMDFDTKRWKLLREEHEAARLTTALGVVLALSGPYIFTIGHFTIINMARVVKRVTRARSPERQDLERQPLVPPQSQPLRPQQELSVMEFLERSKDIGSGRGYVRSLTKARREAGGCQVILLAIVAVILMCLWVGRVVGGIFATEVMTDGNALWTSQHCGVWEFDSDNSGDSAATRHDVLDRMKESRAGEYAKSCYDTPHVLQSMSCNFFTQPNINFTSSYTYLCPFEDPNLCVKGAPAVTFDTGLVEASSLGINAPPDDIYKFHRSSTCVPLSVDFPYVKNRERNGTTIFDYYYGQISDDDYSREATFSSTGNPFDVRVPAYDLEVYTWDPDSSSNYWVPRPSLRLRTAEKYSLTIMFMSPLRLLFVEPSNDPVFPIDKAYDIDDDPNPWYYKSDPRYRVLVCSDSQRLCSSDGQQCWSRTNRVPELPPAYWLLDLALPASNIYDSIAKRLGSALIAQEKVSQFMSAALPKDHWVAEARRLFASSLARIQFDTWSIASGEDAVHVGADGYIDKTPEQAGNLCGIYKFRSTGYRNIDFLAFLLIIFLVPLPAWALSQRVPKSWRTRASSSRQNGSIPQLNTESSDSFSASVQAHTDYGTIGATDRQNPGSDVDPDSSEILVAGPSNIERSVSDTGNEDNQDDRTKNGKSNRGREAVPVAGPVADRDGRLTAGRGESRETDNAQHDGVVDEEEDNENIILFWILGVAWSALFAKAARLRSK